MSCVGFLAGTTPLMACLMTNRQALMEMIVMLGPDFTLQDDQGRTALMFAVEVNSSSLSHSRTHMHGCRHEGSQPLNTGHLHLPFMHL